LLGREWGRGKQQRRGRKNKTAGKGAQNRPRTHLHNGLEVRKGQEDVSGRRSKVALLLFILDRFIFFLFFGDVVVFFVVLFFIVLIVVLFLVVIIIIEVVGDGVQGDRMRLRNFELALALGAAQDLSLFHFVFVNVDLCGTFWAAKHDCTLRFGLELAYPHHQDDAFHRIIYRSRRIQSHATQFNLTGMPKDKQEMNREYPDRPVVGVGGVVIENSRTLLIRRGSEPLRGQWSIPGGLLELGESLEQGVARELLEETGLEVRVVELIEVFDRIYSEGVEGGAGTRARPRYHYVIVDYLCERIGGEARAGSDVTDVAYAAEDDLARFALTPTATRVLQTAFAMDRARGKKR
jgi:8-oxo-dGTP diphosphatase